MKSNKPDAQPRIAELCRTERRLLPAGALRAQGARGGVAKRLVVDQAPAPQLAAVRTRTVPRGTVPAVCRRRPQLDLQNTRGTVQLSFIISKGIFLSSSFRNQTYAYLFFVYP